MKLAGVIDHDRIYDSSCTEWGLKQNGKLGFYGHDGSKTHGGGMDTISYAINGRKSLLDSSCSAAHVSPKSLGVCWGFREDGNAETKYLVPLAKGEKIRSICTMEPEVGSDATSQKTRQKTKAIIIY